MRNRALKPGVVGVSKNEMNFEHSSTNAMQRHNRANFRKSRKLIDELIDLNVRSSDQGGKGGKGGGFSGGRGGKVDVLVAIEAAVRCLSVCSPFGSMSHLL